MKHLQLGELLVRHGVLTEAQRDQVLEAQRHRGGPFGMLAEEMFGIAPNAVEKAWAEQYACMTPVIDPRTYAVQSRALEVINRRQAWQFRVLPLEISGGNLVACTTKDNLVRALRFAGWKLGHQTHFLLAEPLALGEAMCEYYPMAGMTAQSVCESVAA